MSADTKSQLNAGWQNVGQAKLLELKSLTKELNIKGQIYGKCEGQNPNGLLTDRIALQLYNILPQKNKNKQYVDIYTENLSLSLASLLISQNYQVVVYAQIGPENEELKLIENLGGQVVYETLKNLEKNAQIAAEENDTLILSKFYEENKDQIQLAVNQEVFDQLQKCDYVFVNTKWSQYFQSERTTVVKVTNEKSVDQDDQTVCVDKKEGVQKCLDFMKKESLQVGMKSGFNLCAVEKFIKQNSLENQNLTFVVILEDSYKTTSFLNDTAYLVGTGYLNHQVLEQQDEGAQNDNFSDLDIRPCPYYDKRMTLADCFDLLKKGKKVIPIRDKGEIIGVVDEKILVRNYYKYNLHRQNSCVKCLKQDFLELPYDVKMQSIDKVLEKHEYVLITKRDEGKIRQLFVVTTDNILDKVENYMKEILQFYFTQFNQQHLLNIIHQLQK